MILNIVLLGSYICIFQVSFKPNEMQLIFM